MGVEDLAITAAKTNVVSHRFYERHGFTQGFVVCGAPSSAPSVPAQANTASASPPG